MVSRAIPRTIRIKSLAAILCLITLLVTFFPCFARSAQAQLTEPQASMPANHCGPCCKVTRAVSSLALCCEAHPQPAQPTQPATKSSIAQGLTLRHPKTITAEIRTTTSIPTNNPRPPLLTILRI